MTKSLYNVRRKVRCVRYADEFSWQAFDPVTQAVLGSTATLLSAS